jgi:1-deoxy-D-xylulose-5-phosphate reductoisomerase
MIRIAVLGSTGSIGRSALAVVDAHPDRLQVVALAAGRNVDALAAQIRRFGPRVASVGSGHREDLRARGVDEHATALHEGPQGLLEVATHPDVDIVLCASSGTAALEAVLAAIAARKRIALANKEVLVMAGALVTQAARREGVELLPVDSEHNAIHQCLHGRSPAEITRLILTASGGPFRNATMAELGRVQPEDALKHPTWQMGRKITIDSATLMNKGLEVIEAHWLFGTPASRIDVLIHPQSIVHSLVELRDGSTIAQLGVTDMRLPIQYAFSYPDRWDASLPVLNLAKAGPLEFCEPDRKRFACLNLAYAALETGGTMPVVLNAANEVAVDAFLEGRIPFPAIAQVIEHAMSAHSPLSACGIEGVREIDTWAREHARVAVGAAGAFKG